MGEQLSFDFEAPAWRRMVGFPDYEISEHGIVRRLTKARTRHAGHYPRGGRSREGYIVYKLVGPTGKQQVRAHRAVLEAFVGPCPENMQAAHFDGNPRNNHVSNLRWATIQENAQDRMRHGTGAGERNGRARLTAPQVAEVRARYTGKYGEQRQFAREYGLSPSAMRSILNGENWRGQTIQR